VSNYTIARGIMSPYPRLRSFVTAVVNLLSSREHVLGLECVSSAGGTEDLLLLAPPFGVVDGIDPVLNLHDDAAVLGDVAAASLSTLGRLDRQSTWHFC